MVEAALTPETFRQIYDYFRRKKLPEPTFFQNTVVREFAAREHAERCVAIFNANIEQVNLVRVVTTGRWLSTDSAPAAALQPEARFDESESTYEHSSEREATLAAASSLPEHRTETSNPTPSAILLEHGRNKQPLDQLKSILDPSRIRTDVFYQLAPVGSSAG